MTVDSESAVAAIERCFELAQAASPAHHRRLVVAGRHVDARVCGDALAGALGGPVAHLSDDAPVPAGSPPGAGADLTVRLFSVAESGVEAPLGELARLADIDETHGSRDEELRIESGGGAHFHYRRGAECCLWLDRSRRLVTGWFSSAAGMNAYERGRPLHAVLLPWLEPEPLWVLHAGLVAGKAGGVLLPGAGGSGKSTVTVACALAGMPWAADDVAIVERGRDGWFGHGVYSTAKLDRERLDLVPAAAPAAEPEALAEGPKSVVHLSRLPGVKPVSGTPVRAIAFPAVTGDDAAVTSLEAIGPAEALRELIDGTVRVTAPRERTAVFDTLAELVSEVPAHRLHVGRGAHGLEPVPRLIEQLSDGAGG